MPESSSSQDGDDLSDIGAWIARRNAQRALQPQADAMARNLWNQATQNGSDLYAGNPSDLSAIGLAALTGTGLYPTTGAANDQGADDDVFGPASVATGVGLSHDGTGASAGPADGAGPGLSRTGSRAGSPISRDQNPGLGSSLPGDTNAPAVSELEVVGRPANQALHSSFLDSLNHNATARVAAGGIGYLIGLPVGVGRAGWHALQGLDDGLHFAESLASPEGRTKAWNDTRAATHSALQYGRSVVANPSRLSNDAASAGKDAIHSLVPFTTPMASTALGELSHEFGIGMNAGETATNVAGVIAAPEVFEGLNAARTFAATREANVAKFMAQGFDEPTARYLAKPYEGQGDHAVVQKSRKSIFGFKTPLLKDVPIPRSVMDSPLNVSRPRGLSQGDFYEYHYRVDPQFYGGKLPAQLNEGKGWSGNRLGLERDGGLARAWGRIPPIYKDYDVGVTLGDALGQLPQSGPETPQ